MEAHKRLDIVISQLANISRSAAKELIITGKTRVNGVVIVKPGAQISTGDNVEYLLPEISYVSRGGHKLAAALDNFHIDLLGRICLDIGASTGGFTDCMLHRGAVFVHALDVGTAQLHPTLRADTRVRSLENTNILDVPPDGFTPVPSFATIDVSFVSAAKILPHVANLDGIEQIVVLVKPQFECGRAALNKRGIVIDERAHKQAVINITSAGKNAGLRAAGICESPIKGGDGNTEYLALFDRML